MVVKMSFIRVFIWIKCKENKDDLTYDIVVNMQNEWILSKLNIVYLDKRNAEAYQIIPYIDINAPSEYFNAYMSSSLSHSI